MSAAGREASVREARKPCVITFKDGVVEGFVVRMETSDGPSIDDFVETTYCLELKGIGPPQVDFPTAIRMQDTSIEEMVGDLTGSVETPEKRKQRNRRNYGSRGRGRPSKRYNKRPKKTKKKVIQTQAPTNPFRRSVEVAKKGESQ